jgi:hypothetical protein
VYNCINSILNQSFSSFDYYINVSIESDEEEILYKEFLQDFLHDPRLHVEFSYNDTQHENYLKPLMSATKTKRYDLFIKIDDDDIYHKQYIKNIIELYNKNTCDILSLTSKFFIKNHKIIRQKLDHIAGIWHEDASSDIKFGLPPTYIFNRTAFDIIQDIDIVQARKIHFFEDAIWRHYWRENNLKSVVVEDNDRLFSCHRHQDNVSDIVKNKYTDKQYIDIDNALICLFKHPYWISYLYVNKTNNKVYNIENDDYGTFVLDKDTITIEWEKWGTECFYKVADNNLIYYEYR